jgi:predicted DNA-binding protein (MmcQ/YjbR family)
MPPSPLTRVRKLCLALPGAHEVEAWGEPTFRVKNKLFAMYAAANNHHGAGHHAIWVKSTALNQELMVHAKPRRYFVPPYVGPSGWVGVRLDGRVNWTELRELLADAHELATSKKRR